MSHHSSAFEEFLRNEHVRQIEQWLQRNLLHECEKDEQQGRRELEKQRDEEMPRGLGYDPSTQFILRRR